MNPLSGPGATALMVLQRTAILERPYQNEQKHDLVSIANGASTPRPAKPDAAIHPISDIFSVQFVDVNKMKINLMERLGQELGISFDDFENASEFGRATQHIVATIRLKDDGADIIRGIEQNLGLDKLGISLDDLVRAIVDPEGREAEKLGAALLREAGLDEDTESELRSPVFDEIGVYSMPR